jgi:hypothetical protein
MQKKILKKNIVTWGVLFICDVSVSKQRKVENLQAKIICNNAFSL